MHVFSFILGDCISRPKFSNTIEIFDDEITYVLVLITIYMLNEDISFFFGRLTKTFLLGKYNNAANYVFHWNLRGMLIKSAARRVFY